MNKLLPGLGLLVGGFLTLAAPQQPAVQAVPVASPTVVVGTFDSRAVATAWVRSEAFATYLRAQQDDVRRALARAKQASDLDLAASLEALGPAMQARIHRQGFGTAPIDDILARLADKLPEIAEQTGVDVIVSKWTLTYRKADAKFVDVTDRLVAEFDPDAATWKVIADLLTREPVPFDRLDDH